MTFSCFAQTDMTYKVTIERETNGKYETIQNAKLSIVNGVKVNFSDIKSYRYISELNSIDSAIEIKTAEYLTGTQLTIESKGDERVTLKLKVLDRDVPVVTGTYEFELEAGRKVDFPAAGKLRVIVLRES